MGGGSRYPYPKWVWSPTGGWWGQPASHRTNALISLGICVLSAYTVFTLTKDCETRLQYPKRWIPSMLWGKDFHDPEYVKMWKERLALEGREWIEPIPSWWPFK